MSDSIDLLINSRVEWIGDKVIIAALRPRHIGAVVTLDFYLSKNPDDYDSVAVMGTLEAVFGTTLLVSGEEYPYDQIANLKVYRRIIK